jgi:hypothetical protein
LMKEILVWLDAAWMVSVNSFQACLWLVGRSEFTAVSFRTPFTKTRPPKRSASRYDRNSLPHRLLGRLR